jgi:26S proteasome regulatory subunit N1
MALLLGRNQTFLEIDDPLLAELNSNLHLSAHFKTFAKELDILEPKTPEEIYRRHLEPSKSE